MSELAHIPFHGTQIVAAKDGETVRVALRPACNALGLDYSSQCKRLERQSWATVAIMTTVGADGKARDMLTVDRPMLEAVWTTFETAPRLEVLA